MTRVRHALAGLTLACFIQTSLTLAVEYEVTFDATWSSQTHPQAITSGAHFSPLIGATHNDQVSFWHSGGIASPGIELMAETGGRSALQSEIEAAIDQRTTQNLILGSGTASPGVTSTTFEISDSHPLVTLVTMVAPAPIGLSVFTEWTFAKTDNGSTI